MDISWQGRKNKDDIKQYNKFQVSHKSSKGKKDYVIYDEVGEGIFFMDIPKSRKNIDIGIYLEPQRKKRLFSLKTKSQNHFPVVELCFYDKDNRLVAIYEKHKISGFFRSTWDIYTDEAKSLPLGKAFETVWGIGLLQKISPLRKYFITDYKVNIGSSTVGYYYRRNHLNDRFVMDLTGDLGRKMDRKVALGLSLVLDIGEFI